MKSNVYRKLNKDEIINFNEKSMSNKRGWRWKEEKEIKTKRKSNHDSRVCMTLD